MEEIAFALNNRQFVLAEYIQTKSEFAESKKEWESKLRRLAREATKEKKSLQFRSGQFNSPR